MPEQGLKPRKAGRPALKTASAAASARRLGRGLEVLIGGAAQSELPELPVEAIHPNPKQPRKRFDGEAAHGLADSVRAQGVIQPVLVRRRAGRRLRADRGRAAVAGGAGGRSRHGAGGRP